MEAAGGQPPSGHVLILGGGTTGQALLNELVRTGAEVVVVERDPSVTAKLRSRGIRAICGEASDRRVLEAAGVDRARVISTVGRASDSEPARTAAGPGTEVLVRVPATEAEARGIREAGGTPVILPEGAAESLMEWYDRSAAELDRRLAERVGARNDREGPAP